jgi:hypothetical protein
MGRKDDGKYRKFEMISLLVLSASLLFIVNSPVNRIQIPNDLISRMLQVHTADTVQPYGQDSIMKTAPKFPNFVPKLLVFDGNKFQVFGLEHKGTSYFENMRYTGSNQECPHSSCSSQMQIPPTATVKTHNAMFKILPQ